MSQLSFLENLLDGAEVKLKPLGEIASITIGEFVHKEKQRPSAQYPVYNGGTSHTGYYDKYNNTGDKIIVSARGANAGFVNKISKPYWAGNSCYSIGVKNSEEIDWRFVYFFLKKAENKLIGEQQKGGIPAISKKQMTEFKIPIPCPDNPEKSLAIQTEIVHILDNFTELTTELTTELNARKKQYNYYRDRLLSFKESNVEWITLEHLCASISAGGDVPKKSSKGQTLPTEEYPYPIYANATGEKGLYGFTEDYKIDSDAVTISARGAKVGYHTVRKAKFTPIIRLIVLVANKNIISTRYLNYVLDMTPIAGTEAGIPQLTVPMVKKITVPIPFPNDPKKSLSEQARIVAILDKFDTLTTSMQGGLPREIELRKNQYEYYRDLLLNFPKKEYEAV